MEEVGRLTETLNIFMEKGFENIQVTDEMPESWRHLRSQIFETISNRVEGLDVERATAFVRAQGLPVCDFLIFENEDLPKIQEILRPSGLLRGVFSGEVKEKGLYIPEIDLLLVLRDTFAENQNGSFNSEATLVHELMHASSQYKKYGTITVGTWTLRTGYSLNQN